MHQNRVATALPESTSRLLPPNALNYLLPRRTQSPVWAAFQVACNLPVFGQHRLVSRVVVEAGGSELAGGLLASQIPFHR